MNNPAVEEHLDSKALEFMKGEKAPELIRLACQWPGYFVRAFPVSFSEQNRDSKIQFQISCTGVRIAELNFNGWNEIIGEIWEDFSVEEVTDTKLTLQMENMKQVIFGNARAIEACVIEYKTSIACNFLISKARRRWASPDENGFKLSAGENAIVLDRSKCGEYVYGSNGKGQYGWVPMDRLVPNMTKQFVPCETTALDELKRHDEIAKDRTEFPLLEYANVFFDLRTDAPENLRIATISDSNLMVERLSWQCDPMVSSLTLLDPEDDKLAVAAFQNLLIYMGEAPPSGKQGAMEAGQAVIHTGFKSPKLHDEILCQVVKQLTANCSRYELSYSKCLGLLLACLTFFVPTKDLEPFFISYLRSAQAYTAYPELVKQCMETLKRTQSSPPRQLPTSIPELVSITSGVLLPIEFTFPNDQVVPYHIGSYTTAADMLAQFETLWELKRDSEFGLIFTYGAKGTTIPVLPKDRILDLVALGLRSSEDPEDHSSYKIIYTRLTWLSKSFIGYTERAISMVYHQLRQYFLAGHILTHVDMQDKTRVSLLMNLQLLVEPQGHSRQFLDTCPITLRESPAFAILKPEPVNRDRKGAMMQFIEILSGWELYGHRFFQVDMSHDARFESGCLFCVSPTSIKFLNPKKREVLISFGMDDVTAIKCSSSAVVMKAGNLLKKHNIRFQTPEGYLIDDLIDNYRGRLNKESPSVEEMVDWDV